MVSDHPYAGSKPGIALRGARGSPGKGAFLLSYGLCPLRPESPLALVCNAEVAVGACDGGKRGKRARVLTL